MTFEVKYRNKQGAVEYTRVDAASRSEVFTVLKDRGITSVIQVLDATGKKPHKVASSGAPISGKIKGLMALVAVCVIGAVVFMFVSKDEPKPTVGEKKPAKEKRIEVVTPEVVEKVVETQKVVANPNAPLVEEVRAMTPRERQLAEIKRKIKEHPERMPETNLVFRTKFEQTLSMLFTTELGMPPLPFPPLSELERKKLADMLISDTPIEVGDSDLVATHKEIVQQVKKEMISYIKDGGDPQKFIDYYYNELRSMADRRSIAVTQSRKVMKEEPEVYYQFVDSINEQFAEEGIKPIPKLPLY